MRSLSGERLIACVLIFIIIATASSQKWSKTAKGEAVGVGAGGTIRDDFGKAPESTTIGILADAAIGGAAGASIDRYMDKQAEKIIKDLVHAKVERIGEGIKITFPSGILFEENSAVLKSESKANLGVLASTLEQYKDTEIVIRGYTDNTGTEEYNKQLSERRAEAVSNYLRTIGVGVERLTPIGFGEAMPIVENATEAGSKQNRPVEFVIFANDKLKRAAKRGDI